MHYFQMGFQVTMGIFAAVFVVVYATASVREISRVIREEKRNNDD